VRVVFILLYYSREEYFMESIINKIPKVVLSAYNTLKDKGYKVYLVGGGVRNLLMDIPVKDWDLSTNATPDEITTLFKDSYYNNLFGTVGLPVDINGTKSVIEITTFRSEGEYKDRRRPESVEWGKTIEDDLSRRDFTINAIALRFAPFDGSQDKQDKPSEVEFADPFNGRVDIKNKLIKAVGDPKKRFKEDALRLMRAVRIATQLSFTIDDATWKEIQNDAKLIRDISGERIRDELLKILGSENSYEGTIMLKDSGLLEEIIPELLEGEGISQARPGRHHTEDVLTHNLLSLKHSPTKNSIVRLAALLHDVGKPKALGKDEEGLVTFYNHEVAGAKIVKEIAQRLRLSKKETERIVTLVRWHMFTVDEKITDAAVRRFIRRIGVENVTDMMDLRIGDRLGGGTQTAESWRLKLFKKRVEKELSPKPFSIEDMAIDGNDVMKELGIKPGRRIGEILQALFEEVDEDLSKNTKEHLLQRIKDLGK